MRLALVLAVAARDWRLFWADRRAAALGFVLPAAAAGAGYLASGPRGFWAAMLLGLLLTGVQNWAAFGRGQPRGVGLRVRAAPVPGVNLVAGAVLVVALVTALQFLFATGLNYAVFGALRPRA